MEDIDKIIEQVLKIAKKFGFIDIVPNVLSDSGNLIVHLHPHPIVARVALVNSEKNSDSAQELLTRELQISRHLQEKSVPVLLPTDLIDPGPHEIDGIWMTFWNYIPHIQLKPLAPKEAVKLVNELSTAMKDFSNPIPVLGVWDNVRKSARRLMKNLDHRIMSLLKIFENIDNQMKRMERRILIPAHGDAHVKNLLPSPEGFLWMDFEDASLMPPYWDLASFVANLVLFNGFKEPIFTYMLENSDIVSNKEDFSFALKARILMSTIGNLDLALEGYGDLEFATRQLELAEDFLNKVDFVIKKKGDNCGVAYKTNEV